MYDDRSDLDVIRDEFWKLQQAQRAFAIAIMSTILASVSNDPNFDSIAMAELLMAKVEERQL